MTKVTIHDEIIVKRNKPKNLQPDDNILFKHEYVKKIPKSYIMYLQAPLIINDSIFDLKNLSLHFDKTFYASHNLSKKVKDSAKNLIKSKKGKKYLKKGIWITDSKSENFGHWMIDAMCRLVMVLEINKNFPVLLPSRFDIPWITEMLNYAKIDFLILEKNQKYLVDELILTSQAHPSGNFNPDIINNLKHIFSQESANNIPNKRIWASREHISRGVGNFDEITTILKKYNFEFIKTEQLSLEEKLKIFSNAEVIAGTHGSGLINMLFMQEKTKLFEVRDYRDSHKNAMFSLASALNIDYFYTERSTSLLDHGLIDPNLFEKSLNECLKG